MPAFEIEVLEDRRNGVRAEEWRDFNEKWRELRAGKFALNRIKKIVSQAVCACV